jgi:hypothetical protein
MVKAALQRSTRIPHSDPVFAALDNHRKLDRLWLDYALEEAGGGSRHELDLKSEAAEEAAWKLARTKPTTPAGAAEMLAYITTGPITGLFELGETDWHETAFRTVVASLAEITGQSNQAA